MFFFRLRDKSLLYFSYFSICFLFGSFKLIGGFRFLIFFANFCFCFLVFQMCWFLLKTPVFFLVLRRISRFVWFEGFLIGFGSSCLEYFIVHFLLYSLEFTCFLQIIFLIRRLFQQLVDQLIFIQNCLMCCKPYFVSDLLNEKLCCNALFGWLWKLFKMNFLNFRGYPRSQGIMLILLAFFILWELDLYYLLDFIAWMLRFIVRDSIGLIKFCLSTEGLD